MAAWTYDVCLQRLLAHEGGYSNHPSDPGGPTNYGITIADYRKYVMPNATAADVRAMSISSAKTIYRTKYWAALACDALPAGVDYAVFDYGVNSGIGRAGRVLRRVCGVSDQDWPVTASVLTAVRARDPSAIADAICDERLRFLRSLRTWPTFGKGWSRRVAEVKAFARDLAARGQANVVPFPGAPQATPAAAPGKGVLPPPRTSKAIVAGAGAPPLAAAHPDAWHWLAAHPIESGLIMLAAAGALALALHLIRRAHAVRAVRPMPVASVPASVISDQ